MEPVYMQAWNYDNRMVVAGPAVVTKVAGGHMVAGASSQKSIYRSFDEFNGINQYAQEQGVQFSMKSRGRAFGIGLVQAREDQFEYGAPQDYRYSGTGFILYVGEDGSIRIEEKAGVSQRSLAAGGPPAASTQNHFRKKSASNTRKLHHLAESIPKSADASMEGQQSRLLDTDSLDSAQEYHSEAPIFCNFKDEYTGYCEQCYSASGCSGDNLNSHGRKACLASCSNFNADLPPMNVKKHACSKSKPCSASNYKVDKYEKSEELYISAVCPPRYVAAVLSTAAVAGEYSASEAASDGYRRLQGDPCHFGFAVSGDTFAITVDSARLQVQYWHNNRVIYKSLMVPQFPMLIDAYMIDQGAKASNIMWKCPPKRCPAGTSSSQCKKLRAKAPAGCNFINENFDNAHVVKSEPYMQPPKGSGKDGATWWIWVVVAVAVVLCCCCGFMRANSSSKSCSAPCCSWAQWTTPSTVPMTPMIGSPALTNQNLPNQDTYWKNMQKMNPPE